MSIDIVASEDAKAQEEFIGWEDVPRYLKTRNGWEGKFRKVKNGEKAVATVVTMKTMRLECADKEYEVKGQSWKLYHHRQTKPVKKTALNMARHQFWEIFGQTNDRSKLIRWTKGEWVTNEAGERHWDSEADVWGWKTFTKEWFTQPKCIDHDMGRELYGVFGAQNSYYLMIDLDLHGGSLTLFLRRLAVLLDAFWGRYGCHLQVSNNDAGGVHLLLYFGKPSPLKTRVGWLLRELSELDLKHPECEFFRTQKNGKKICQLEIYPSPHKAHRLPLARGRTMLLDKPLELVTRHGKRRQDVVGYMQWLTDPTRIYMLKDDVFRYVVHRLTLPCVCAEDDNEEAVSQKTSGNETCEKMAAEKRTSQNPDAIFEPQRSHKATTSESRNYSLKGKTRGAIIGFWKRGEPEHFRNLNTAVYTTLQALRAQGCDRKRAVETVMQYVRDLPNNNLSSRLPDGLPEIERVVERDSVKIWNVECNGKWKASSHRWAEIGFRVDDKATWNVSGKTPEVVVDCEEIEFNDDERRLIVNELTPLLVGAKQALKPAKQQEVEHAVAYFLRFVRCCNREIPERGLPEILSDYQLKLRGHDKQGPFFQWLLKHKWIYVRAHYYHPARHGVTGAKPRATAYGVGPAMIEKFSLPREKQKEEQWSYILSPTFCEECEETGSEIEIPSFDDQLMDMQADPSSFDTERRTDLVSARLGQQQHPDKKATMAELRRIQS